MKAFELGATLTYRNVMSVLDVAVAAIEKKTVVVDAGQLTCYDSSALALLIELKRVARQRNKMLEIIHLPDKLLNLAQAYGVASLIVDK